MDMVKELYVDSIAFSYSSNREPLLTGVYLKCSPGDVIALLGRNGCGKSTLMKIIFGTLKAHHSFIRLNGEKVDKCYRTKKVGYLPQHSFLPPSEKVCKLITLLVENPTAKDELLNGDRIQEMKDRKVYQLSGGERRYLELQLLINQPTDFLLLDEPFSGLEPIYKTLMIELIALHQMHKGFIISDHNYRDVLDVASQIILLQNGGCRYIQDQRELEYFYVPEGTFEQK